MSHLYIKFHSVTFGYETHAHALIQNATLHISKGWSGVVGPNGAGKTTLLKLAAGLISPQEGHIDRPRRVVYCPQRTDVKPAQLERFLEDADKNAHIIKGQLGIENDWGQRWDTLSHGERKRIQIGIALWFMPDALAIDEPTNHVDAYVRKLLQTVLTSFTGIGLLVSHDRQLLDSLCNQCLFIEPPNVICRKGNYTKGREVGEKEREMVQRQWDIKKGVVKRLRREAGKRRDTANQADRKRSKKHIGKKDHDAKAKINGARCSGKDGIGGKLLRQLDGRISQAQVALEGIAVQKDYTLGIWLPGSTSKKKLLLRLDEGSLALGTRKQLFYPDLYIKPDDRIGITGQNGAGKSTLLRNLLPDITIPREHITYIPQEIDLAQSQYILKEAQTLSNEQKGHLMNIVSRLGSRPHRLLESATPSPGETRKLMLALGMTKRPQIVILDEPTNHMDLPSIECLENALSLCPCCLILISHDDAFLKKLIRQHWHISKTVKDRFDLEIMASV